jgi:4'-phosphopantetheinyl transferase
MQISDPGPLAGEVHIWHGQSAGEPHSADFALLSAAEQARAARFARPGDRARFVAAHAAQRRLLAHYLGTDPAAIRLGRSTCCKCGSGEHGRPVVEWPAAGLSHNLSRSAEHWLLAVAAGGPVGVDIECHRGIDHDRMAEACLTESERSYLRGQRGEQRRQVFFRCWTRKEAVLKACGVGLAAKLTSLEVYPAQPGAVEVHHSSGSCPDTWLVQDLANAAGTASAAGTAAAGGARGSPGAGPPAGSAGPPAGSAWSAAAAQPASQPGRVRLFTFPSCSSAG